ncbi:MAG TPA: pentapeptide repeat-containing protein, partial [Actinomycetota bacterium]
MPTPAPTSPRRLNGTLPWVWAVAVTAVVLLLGAAVMVLPKLLIPGSVTPQQADALKAQDDLRTILVQSVGGLLLVGGVVATWRQVTLGRRQLEIMREGQLTERFSRAIEQLGSDKLDVRLGAIYALERIAVASADERGPILEVLTAYVRGHSPWPPSGWDYGTGTPSDDEEADRPMRSLQFRAPDVAAVVIILGRRPASWTEPEELLLSRVDLRQAYLRRANFDRFNLRNANLRRVQARGAHLRAAKLKYANLAEARLDGADLRDAELVGANLRGADLRLAKLGGADLRGADL